MQENVKKGSQSLRCPLFSVGYLSITPGAIGLLASSGVSPASLVERHESGDFGIVLDQDQAANLDAIKNGGHRVHSCFEVDQAEGPKRLWVITDVDRNLTTIMLSSEYSKSF